MFVLKYVSFLRRNVFKNVAKFLLILGCVHASLLLAVASNSHGVDRGERDREIQYQIQKIERERGNDGAIDCQMKRKMGGRTLGAVGKGTRNYFMAPARNLKRNPVCATP